MADEMLFLANCGVEILRLDAVAFIWKELGTSCENLPQAHRIIRAFNAICRIAAPALVFKSEAIVHPDDVKKYIHPDECHLSYNPLLMALLWTCLAAQEVRLLNVSMQKRFSIHPDSAWVNYIRCHDDIGWTFDDTDAQELHIHPFYHRQWLNEFYSGRFPGSFASGLLFQENPKTGDARISGTTASLAGLEKALTENDETLVEMAVRRILLMHGIILTIGGIPLIYLGDEIGQLNDNAFLKDPQKAKDSRWLHRPKMTWEKTGLRLSKKTVQGRIFRGLMKRIEIRKENPVFTGGAMEVIQTGNDHIFAFTREYKRERCAVLTNFSSSDQEIPASLFAEMSFKGKITELITDVQIPAGQNYVMGPYEQIIII
jgi:glycosidase